MPDASDPSPDALERRVVEATRKLLSAPGRDAPGADVDAGGLRQLSGVLERWVHAAALSRWFRTSGSDVVGTPGTEVELSAQIGTAVRLRAAKVAFEIEGRVVAEAPIESDRPDVRASYVPERDGVWPIHVRALDAQGAVVAGSRAEETGRLFVLDDTPVLAVSLFDVVAPDGSIDGRVARRLEPWRKAGFVIVYLGAVGPEGIVDLRTRIAAASLPEGAILAPAELAHRFQDLGVDFRATFAAIAIRRARARGVPIVGLLGSLPGWSAAQVADCPAFDWDFQVPSEVIARRAEHARVLRAEHRKTGGDVGFRIEQMTGARAIEGNAVAVEFDGHRARRRCFELVEGAQRSIHLQTYMFRSGRFADELGARLVRRARAGVRVRVLVDGLYGAPEAVIGRFGVLRLLGQEPNVDVRLRDPVAVPRIDPRVWKHRDHRKILVVDGERAMVGGRNVGDEYFTGFDEVAVGDWTPSERVPWLDAHAEVEGPAAAAFERAFIDAWLAHAPDDQLGGFVAAHPRVCGDVVARAVLHEGLGDARALGLFEAMFDGATSRIVIVNDFPVTEALADALYRARRRGVRVTLLTGSAVARRGDGKMLPGVVHRELFEYMTKDRFEPLLRHGIEIFEYVAPRHDRIVCAGGFVRPYVHAKVVVVDGEHATIGSANLDATASYWEREANIVIHGRDAVAPVASAIDRMLADAIVLDPNSPEWTSETAFRRIARAVWPSALYS
ncbi:MAG: phosphatidylserine/phosphatidylglycerophosphate/cardiolipin synthase family protein [Deltaproteobacteria bacterium]|nr:MAG: phosphatidylserine/phosphatidylglycerophosphate/cardiolipin synthase family protein [Deltaproteobacteria bacterium]